MHVPVLRDSGAGQKLSVALSAIKFSLVGISILLADEEDGG